MEKDKELKIQNYLIGKQFNKEQIDLVIRLIDGACIKLLDDVIIAFNKKKLKIQNE